MSASEVNNSIDINEIKKFSEMADEWWNPVGKFKILHKFNPVRIKYIVEQILQITGKNSIKGITILDIGCGGGLVAEAIAKLGAKVTAIDPTEKNIMVAKSHQLKSKSTVEYVNTTIEQLQETRKFDVVLCLEVIEHVSNPKAFLDRVSNFIKPDGILYVATISRTIKSLLLAKFSAEYILNWVPKGTHHWKKFLKPSEINNFLSINDKDGHKQTKNKFILHDIRGFKYNILNNNWVTTKNLDQNYIMCYKA